jgi:hypothetical protein
MGTRFEFFEAKRSVVRVWDAVQTEDEAGEGIGAGRFTLALDGDTVAGFVGTLDELRTLVARITRELDAAEPALPSLPEPEATDEEVEATCPHVNDDGTVCGAELMLWDKDPVGGYLYTEGGRWIVGPRKGGDNVGGDEEVYCNSGHQWAVPEIDEWQ